MKFIVLAIFVAIASMPVQASSCDMHDESAQPHAQHEGMQMDPGSAMDCCDDEPDGAPVGCDSNAECSTCTSGTSAVLHPVTILQPPVGSTLPVADDRPPGHSSDSPPFRPPIG